MGYGEPGVYGVGVRGRERERGERERGERQRETRDHEPLGVHAPRHQAMVGVCGHVRDGGPQGHKDFAHHLRRRCAGDPHTSHRGSSLIRNRFPLGPYKRPMPRAQPKGARVSTSHG